MTTVLAQNVIQDYLLIMVRATNVKNCSQAASIVISKYVWNVRKDFTFLTEDVTSVVIFTKTAAYLVAVQSMAVKNANLASFCLVASVNDAAKLLKVALSVITLEYVQNARAIFFK